MPKINLITALTYDDVLLAPQYSEVLPTDTSLATQLGDLKLSLPFLSAPMDTITEAAMARALAKAGGLGIIHKNMTAAKQAGMIRSLAKQKLLIGAAVGVGDEQFARAKWCIADGATVIVVDSAHGHSKGVLAQVRRIKKTFRKKVIVVGGNVATREGTRALIKAGADVVKVGMGPGSICTTRVIAGIGVPQFTAVLTCAAEARKSKTAIIADGGLKTSGDIVKALAAGANAIMSGNLFAATKETPGEIITIKGQKMKAYRGMGSAAAMQLGSKDRYGQTKITEKKKLVPEGVVGYKPYRGPVQAIIEQLAGGVRAGLGYNGARHITDLQKKAQFVRITNAGLQESHPHSLEFINPA